MVSVNDRIAIVLLVAIILGATGYFVWVRYKGKTLHPRHSLYDLFEPYAEILKTILQMIIGGGLVILVFIKLLYAQEPYSGNDYIVWAIRVYHLTDITVLDIVAEALGYATAIELAYTLFTPGPDEAINPLITGVAAVMLLGLGHAQLLESKEALTTGLYTITLAGLFMIRKYFILKPGKAESPKKN